MMMGLFFMACGGKTNFGHGIALEGLTPAIKKKKGMIFGRSENTT
jgi:hypothetical protein